MDFSLPEGCSQELVALAAGKSEHDFLHAFNNKQSLLIELFERAVQDQDWADSHEPFLEAIANKIIHIEARRFYGGSGQLQRIARICEGLSWSDKEIEAHPSILKARGALLTVDHALAYLATGSSETYKNQCRTFLHAQGIEITTKEGKSYLSLDRVNEKQFDKVNQALEMLSGEERDHFVFSVVLSEANIRLVQKSNQIDNLTIEDCRNSALQLNGCQRLTSITLKNCQNVIPNARNVRSFTYDSCRYNYPLPSLESVEHFEWKDSEMPLSLKLISLSRMDPERALLLADAMGLKREVVVCYRGFCQKNEEQSEGIALLFERLDIENLLPMNEGESIPFIHSKELEAQPVTQLLLINIYKKNPELFSFEESKELIDAFLESPLDDDLIDFLIECAVAGRKISSIPDHPLLNEASHDRRRQYQFFLAFEEGDKKAALDKIKVLEEEEIWDVFWDHTISSGLSKPENRNLDMLVNAIEKGPLPHLDKTDDPYYKFALIQAYGRNLQKGISIEKSAEFYKVLFEDCGPTDEDYLYYHAARDSLGEIPGVERSKVEEFSDDHLKCCAHFALRDPTHGLEIANVISRCDVAKMVHFLESDEIPLVNSGELKDDVIQQLFLLNEYTKNPEGFSSKRMQDYFRAVMVTPMDDLLKDFYMALLNGDIVLNPLDDYSIFEEAGEKKRQCLLLRPFCDQEDPHKMLEEIKVLEQLGLIEPYWEWLKETGLERAKEHPLSQLVSACQNEAAYFVAGDPRQNFLLLQLYLRGKTKSVPIEEMAKLLKHFAKVPMDMQLEKLYVDLIECEIENRAIQIEIPHPISEKLEFIPQEERALIHLKYECNVKAGGLLLLNQYGNQIDELVFCGDLDDDLQAAISLCPRATKLHIRQSRVTKLPDMPQLKSLTLVGVERLQSLPYLPALEHLECKLLNMPQEKKFSWLAAVFAANEERALQFAEVLGIDSHAFTPFAAWLQKYPERREEIARELYLIDAATVVPLLDQEGIFFFEGLENDPIQQLYLCMLFAERGELFHSEPAKAIIRSLIKIPMDGLTRQFYKRMLESDTTLSPPPDHPLLQQAEEEKKREYLFLLVGEKENQKAICDNIALLEKADIWEGFFAIVLEKSLFDSHITELLKSPDPFSLNDEEEIEDFIQAVIIYSRGTKGLLELEHDEAVDFLQLSKIGETWARSESQMFLNDSRLQRIYVEAFSPRRRENKAFYPIVHKVDDAFLKLTLLATLPLDNPDYLFDVLKGYRDLLPDLWRIQVSHYASPAIDAGGPSRQLMSQWFSGTLKESKIFSFREHVEGRRYPVTNSDALSNQERANWEMFGRLMGYSLKRGYAIGDILSHDFLRLVHSFTEVELDREAYTFESANVEEEVDFIQKYITPNIYPIEVGGDLIGAAREYNEYMEDEALGDAIEAGDKDAVRLRLLEMNHYKNHLRSASIAHAVAKGINNMLPFKIGGEEVKSWSEFQALPPEAFVRSALGVLTADGIKAHLKCDDPTILTWLHEWVDANSDNKETLANFVEAITGSRAMVGSVTFKKDRGVSGIRIATCSDLVLVESDMTKETLHAELTHYGKVGGKEYTSA